jgi:hypothetical protein
MLANLFALLLTVLIAHQDNHLISWTSSRKLTWDDFRGPVDPGSKNAALTISNINIEFQYDDKELVYSIKCTFNKQKSWVRIRNNDVLAHEQGHFDLAEVHARRLYKAMKEYKFNPGTVGDDVNRIYNSVMKMHHEAQHQYDQETDYSRNRPKQLEWEKKIAAELKSLQAYANYQK